MLLVSGTIVAAWRLAFLTAYSPLFPELAGFSGFAVRLSLISGMQPADTVNRGRRFLMNAAFASCVAKT
jgi:hypothetical protein